MPRRKQVCPKRMKYEASKDGDSEGREKSGEDQVVTDSTGNESGQSGTEDEEMTEGEEEDTKDVKVDGEDTLEESCHIGKKEEGESKVNTPKMFKPFVKEEGGEEEKSVACNKEISSEPQVEKEEQQNRPAREPLNETAEDTAEISSLKTEKLEEESAKTTSSSSSSVSSAFSVNDSISKLESMSKSHLEMRDVSLVGLMSQHLLPVSSTISSKNLMDSTSPLSKLQDIVMSTTPRHSPRKPQVSALSKFYVDSLKPKGFQNEQPPPPPLPHHQRHKTRSPLKQPSPPKSPASLSVPSVSRLIGQPMVAVPSFETDQPLDLSCKKKRPGSPDPSQRGANKRLGVDFSVPLSPNASVSASAAPDSSSCLASLEQKFGGNSYLLDGVGTKVAPPPRRPFISSLGGSLYTTALYGSPMALHHPSRYLPIVPKSESLQYLRSPETPAVKRQASSPRSSQPSKSSSSHSHSHNHSHNHSHSPSHSSAPRALTSSSSEREKEDSSAHGHSSREKKHTNLACVCGKDFETLYDLTIHLQDSGHPPANSKAATLGDYPKLVRGQDMWLNQGSEQTRQILRCMQCGESFKSLPELTVHMIDTKHYTNIVGSEPSKKLPRPSMQMEHGSGSGENVFKCKVCMSDFENMNDLATHMVSTGHHKKQKSVSTSVRSPSSASYQGNSDRGCDSPSALRNSPRPSVSSPFAYPSSDNCDSDEDMDMDLDEVNMMSDSKICCENCSEKIDTYCFVEHVRQCVKSKSCELPSRKPKEPKDPLKIPEATKFPRDHADRAETRDGQPIVPSPEPSKTSIKELTVKQEPDSSQTATIHSSTDFLNKMQPRKSPDTDTMHRSLVHPLPLSSDRSALKAMESFIERSFVLPTRQKHNFLDTHSFRDIMSSNETYPRSAGSPRGRNSPEEEKTSVPGLYENKYLPPLYEGPVAENRERPASEERNGLLPQSAHAKVNNSERAREKESPDGETMTIKTEIEDDQKSDSGDKTPPPKSQSRRRESKTPLRENESANNSEKNKSSALESLQGLVYGKSFNTEHPLDSLQKLIHTTHGPQHPERPNGSQTVVTGKATLQPGMPGTVILVNPIVTVLPNSSAPASVHISMPRDSYSPNENYSKDFDMGSGNESDSEAPADLLCRACKRTFASKGSYRYHLSRCHMSSAAKKCAIKEMINTTPYIYLPLDHSAKFSKYYEMANELANKGK